MDLCLDSGCDRFVVPPLVPQGYCFIREKSPLDFPSAAARAVPLKEVLPVPSLFHEYVYPTEAHRRGILRGYLPCVWVSYSKWICQPFMSGLKIWLVSFYFLGWWPLLSASLSQRLNSWCVQCLFGNTCLILEFRLLSCVMILALWWAQAQWDFCRLLGICC